jgi:hypothetical protein
MKSFTKNRRIIFEKWNRKYDYQAVRLQSRVMSKLIDIDIMTGFNEQLQNEAEAEESPIRAIFDADYSVCAINKDSGLLIAGIKTQLWKPQADMLFQPPISETSHPSEVVYRILYDANKRWPRHFERLGIQPNSNEFLKCLSGFTEESHMNNGIYSELYEFAEKSAKEAGIRYIYRVLASEPVQHLVVKKFKFEVLEEIYLKEIEIDGYRPFWEKILSNPSKINSKIVLAFKEL